MDDLQTASGARHRKILVMGLPGAGKTTLAVVLARRLRAVHFNADDVRANISRDLGFSPADRVEQARRMGWLCDRVTAAGAVAVADFVCPTADTRAAFTAGGPAFTIWMDRIAHGRFADTNRLFTPPERADVRVVADGTPDDWAERVAAALRCAPGGNGPTMPSSGDAGPSMTTAGERWPRQGRPIGD